MSKPVYTSATSDALLRILIKKEFGQMCDDYTQPNLRTPRPDWSRARPEWEGVTVIEGEFKVVSDGRP